MTAKKKTGGLAGVSAGETALCTVGKEGAGLTYRGYDIYDLANNACFEEVAFLILHGDLPNQDELDAFAVAVRHCDLSCHLNSVIGLTGINAARAELAGQQGKNTSAGADIQDYRIRFDRLAQRLGKGVHPDPIGDHAAISRDAIHAPEIN